MNHYLILRLMNAAIDLDRRGQGNLAELITEAIQEIEKPRDDEIAMLKLEITRLRKEALK